ncbi:MAG: endonuclease/exonuclease/phosphatase family protein [Clostridium sp.]|nr:endonuclease/exonuclease/phosphatase family protein [Clostridium sp.]
MKLLTLNSHSLEEEDYEHKLIEFERAILRESPHIIALQEVNQRTAKILPGKAVLPQKPASPPSPPVPSYILSQSGYMPCSPVPGEQPAVIRRDNHAFRAALSFSRKGLPYHWTWIASKIGYDKYDEGLALFSDRPILKTRQFYISESRDYLNWKTRKILGITAETEQGIQEFYTVHMGWWDDGQEPFFKQWNRISRELKAPSPAPVWLMGDFNSPAHISGQGRDLVAGSGWLDTYELAKSRDQGFTVSKAIDGWRGEGETGQMRIDYIWASQRLPVKSSRAIFNGDFYPVVSDHYGIMIEI